MMAVKRKVKDLIKSGALTLNSPTAQNISQDPLSLHNLSQTPLHNHPLSILASVSHYYLLLRVLSFLSQFLWSQFSNWVVKWVCSMLTMGVDELQIWYICHCLLFACLNASFVYIHFIVLQFRTTPAYSQHEHVGSLLKGRHDPYLYCSIICPKPGQYC